MSDDTFSSPFPNWPIPEHLTPDWLDDQEPHEEEVSLRQVSGVLELLGPAPRRVLDLGCGAGRVLVPLMEAGHEVKGVDRDADALRWCRRRLHGTGMKPRLVRRDFTEPGGLPRGPFDAVLCLGNTFMTIWDVDEAVAALTAWRRRLSAGGCILIDDSPRDLWELLTGGSWQSGIAEHGTTQLVWDPGDAVFALRDVDAIDPERPWPDAADRRFRMWTDGALRLAARGAGLSAPAREAGMHLLVMREPGPEAPGRLDRSP